MYPGSCVIWSKGGVSSSTICASRRTRCARTASIALHGPERSAVVEVRAAIPASIPGQLEHAVEPTRLVAIALGKVAPVPSSADRCKLVEHDDEKPSQPDALAAALVANPVHAIVPIARSDERKSMRAVFHRMIDGAHRVLENRRGLLRDTRQRVCL